MKTSPLFVSIPGQSRIIIIAALLPAMLVNTANACQCGSSMVQSPCNSLSTSNVIFLGTVESIDNRPWTEFWSFSKMYSGTPLRAQLGMFRDEVIVKFSVEQVFKGIPTHELSVRVTKFLGSCGFEYKAGELYFKKGEKYLVYAGFYASVYANSSGTDGYLRTNHCSGTTLAANATEKIKAYRALSMLQRPTILGAYNTKGNTDKKTPAVGQTLNLISSTGARLSAPILGDGSFLFTGVLPAKYRLAPTTAKGYAVGFGRGYRIQDRVPVNPETISIGTDSCTELELLALPDGRISGTVVDRNGRPLSNVAVRLWHANDITGLDTWWIWDDKTNSRGQFNRGPLAPGKYVVGVYVWSPDQLRRSQHDQNIKPSLWFYPGVALPKQAKIITLGFADHHSAIRIRVPNTAQ